MLTLAGLWNSRYRMEHRRFVVRTEDGERIAGVHLDRHRGESCIIYAHGFMANKNHLRVPRFVEALAAYTDVIAVDLRGHGESSGGCTMGEVEVLDIEATVAYARSLGYRRVVTVGSSMGGATVIRHAALYGSQAGVVTIGAFADCRDIGRANSDYGLQLLYGSGRLGASYCYLIRGTRLDALCTYDSPKALVDRVAPAPLLLIHGERDRTVHPRAAYELYDAANQPKELLVIPRGGHDFPHLTPGTAARVAAWMDTQGILPAREGGQRDGRAAKIA